MFKFKHRKSLTGVLIALASVMASIAEAQNQFRFGEPENLGPVVNSSSNDMGADLSSDGLILVFYSLREGGYGSWDLWMTTRASRFDPWEPPVNLGPTINLESSQSHPDISADGLTLYFRSGSSSWPGGMGRSDIWMTTRDSVSDPWQSPVNLGPPVNSAHMESTPNISADGLALYFASDRPGGYGGSDLWMTTRATVADPWQTPVNLGPAINTAYIDAEPSISTDGLTLFFSSDRFEGVCVERDVWMTTRSSRSDPWGPPIELPLPVNSASGDSGPSFTADGLTLFYDSARPALCTQWDLWQVAVIPVSPGDCDCDGEVDFFDIDPFLVALSGEAAYDARYPDCEWLNADCDADGDVDFFDIDALVELLGT